MLGQNNHRLVAGSGRHKIRLRFALHLAGKARINIQHRIELARTVTGQRRF